MTTRSRSIYLVSLGCPKNRVDSEVMLGIATQAGLVQAPSAAQADVIVVNTCAFIASAERESVAAILELAAYRRSGKCRCLVVAGCLPQRHATELAQELPEVDHFIGPGDVPKLKAILSGQASRVAVGRPDGWLLSADDPRLLSAPLPAWAEPDPTPEACAPLPTSTNRNQSSAQRAIAPAAQERALPKSVQRAAGAKPARPAAPASAYVKVAEGCDRACAFCVIPSLRGPQRSRPLADIVREATRLVHRGVRELCLVSQDTSAYGRDLRTSGRARGRLGTTADPMLAELVKQIAAIHGLRWVRLLYLYPDALSPELIELLAHHDRVVPYVDMPMQHASDAMLRRMRRGHGARRLRQIVEQLRTSIPNLTLRTAFIVGHPGETPADFDELREFVRWAAPERLAVFRYSDEAGTRSHTLSGKVAPLVAANRERSLMAVGRRISRRNNRALLGHKLEVLVEGPSDEHPLVLMGRHAGQAPEIDGQVYLSTGELDQAAPKRGSLVPAIVTQASDYDLVAEPLS